MCRLARCADFFFFCVISYVRLNSTCSGNYKTALPTHHPRMDAKQVSLVSSRTNKDNKKKVDASGLDDDDDDSNQLSTWVCGGDLNKIRYPSDKSQGVKFLCSSSRIVLLGSQ